MVNIGAGNEELQAITSTSNELLLNESLETNFYEILLKIEKKNPKLFIEENAFENVCKMVVDILFRPQYIN